MPPETAPSADASASPPGTYTVGEVTERIRLYMAIGALTSLIGQLADLGSMQDAQLASVSALRWVIKLTLLLAGVTLAAVNAKRAAIDRSTSSPGTAPAATPAPAALPTP